MSNSGRQYLALCAVAKDEDPFIREWVAYHYLIGFEKIFIYDNESKTPVRTLVPDFFEAGIVDTYVIEGKGMQLTAYDHCLLHHGHEFTWMAFFDLDEFLLLKKDRDARLFLSRYEAYDGVGVNMTPFGSNGRLGRPKGPVLENYVECLGRDVTVKSIVKPERVEMAFTPHDFVFKNKGFAVNAAGLPLFGSYGPVAVEDAQLNHYSFRSQQDYEEKIRRGDAVYTDSNPRTYEKFYAQTRRKTFIDTFALRFVPYVQKLLDQADEYLKESAPAEPPLYVPFFILDTKALSQEGSAEVLRRLEAALRRNDPESARLIFALCPAACRDEKAVLTMGIGICLLCGEYDTSEQLARRLIAFFPEPHSYRELFSVYIAAGKTEQAREIGMFLVTTASYGKNTAFREEVARQAEQAGLILSQG